MTLTRSGTLPTLGLGTDLRLLLIEDSSTDTELVLALLEDELPRARVNVAVNLAEAMRLLSQTAYDIAIADLSLPDAEGEAVVRTVRSAHPGTALLVLTGRVDGELALWALAEGAQDYLVKGEHDGPRLAVAVLHALQRQRAEQEAHRYLELARGLLDALEAPTCAVTTDSRIIAVNHAWRAFMTDNGGEAARCCEGSSYLSACDGVEGPESELVVARAVGDGLRAVLAGELERFQVDYPCHGPGTERWFSVRMTPAQVNGGSGAVISHVEVTEMHRVQRALSHQALHDALTGLPNRLLLADRLNQALLDGDRRGRAVGVAFVDLDHFKRVNDSFGHQAGDELLVQVSMRMTHLMRASDTLARLSGDEFVVVWRDLHSPEEANILSARLAEALKAPYDLGVATVNVSASIGAVISRPLEGAEDLLKAADAAMYEAKRRGGGRVRVFSDEYRQGTDETSATEVDLREALQRRELVVHYQPVIDLATGLAVAVEALVRWQHPVRGLLTPAQFIPVAEASGLIVPLGRWVLEQACADAMAFTGAADGIDVAVNLSASQLGDPGLVADVSAALERSGLKAGCLLLEVTESAMMRDAEAAAEAMEGLTRLGVRIAVDDFGTGYSSLLYVREYPVSALKLDRAFVSGIGVNPEDEAICGSVVSFAHAVGATSIGEGVETMAQYSTLHALGCEQAQGYLWSPAVPADELGAALVACSQVPWPPPQPAGAAAREASGTLSISIATAVAADKAAEAAETARVARAVAVSLAAEAVAFTAAQTADAVKAQAEISAAKVAGAADAAAASLAASLSGGDAASAVTAFRLAATVSAAAVASAQETAHAAAIVARAVAAAASQAAHTASTAAAALEAEVSSTAVAVAEVADEAEAKLVRPPVASGC